MNWLEQLKNASLIEPLGWTILHSLWQGAAIALLTAIALRIARSGSAQIRYVIACAALFSMLITAAVTFAELRPSKVLPTAINDAPVHLVAPTMQPIQLNEPISTIPPVAPSLTDRVRPILPSLALAWIAGVVLLGAYHAGGWMLLRRLRFQSRTIADVSSRALLTDLNAAMRIHRTVQLCESALVQVPTVIGWLSPIILLPTSAIVGLSASELRGLLAHELAHIRRHDYLMNLLQTVIETLLFYHPATWWLGKVIRQERENCCDDFAAAICDRTIYAQALANMESLRQSPQLALSAKGAALLPRIRRILGMPTASNRRPLSSGIVSASILIAVIAGGILLNACRSNAKAPTTKPPQPTTQADIAYTDPTDADVKAPPEQDYRIVPKDVISVIVTNTHNDTKEWLGTRRVEDDGTIDLLKLGSFTAKGRTELELANEMKSACNTIFGPEQYRSVTAKVLEGRGRVFSIRGGVNQPGQYAIPKVDLRLNDVLVLARGLNGPVTTIYVIRNQSSAPKGQRIIRIPLDQLHNDPAHYNIVIYPDDLVQVMPVDLPEHAADTTQPVTINADRITFRVVSRHLSMSFPNDDDLKPSTRPRSETGTYIISGLVGRQGQFVIPPGDFRLLNALDQAHGYAVSTKSITICRGNSDSMRIIYIPLDKLRSHPEMSNVVIYPHDTIVVGLVAMNTGPTSMPSEITSDGTNLKITAAQNQSDDGERSAAGTGLAATTPSGASLPLAEMSTTDQQELLKDLSAKRRDLELQLIDAKQSYGQNNPAVAGLQKRVDGIRVEEEAIKADLRKNVEKDALNSATTLPAGGANPSPELIYYVSGVPRTGVYNLGEKRTTLLQALIAAGFDQSMRDKELTVVHKNGKRVRYNIDEIVDQNGQMSVEPDDVLMVADRGPAEIYIVGDVPRVGVYELPSKGVNLLQAIVMAGGDPTKIMDENVQLRRPAAHNKTYTFMYSVKELKNGSGDQLPLQPDDVVTVGYRKPTSTGGAKDAAAAELMPGAISVEGDVPHPGQYTVNGLSPTVLEAIASAGGDPSKIEDDDVLLRRGMGSEMEESMYWPMKELIDDAAAGERVTPGDRIRVVNPQHTLKPTFIGLDAATQPTTRP